MKFLRFVFDVWVRYGFTLRQLIFELLIWLQTSSRTDIKHRENWQGLGWSFGGYVCQISPVFKMSERKVMAKLSWYLVVLLNNCSCSKRVWDDKHQIWGRCLALLATSSSVHCVTRLIYSNVVTSQYTASTYDVMCSRNFWAFLDHIYDAVEWKTNIINNSNSNKSICRRCLQA